MLCLVLRNHCCQARIFLNVLRTNGCVNDMDPLRSSNFIGRMKSKFVGLNFDVEDPQFS